MNFIIECIHKFKMYFSIENTENIFCHKKFSVKNQRKETLKFYYY